ncbi:hypothetical protein LJC74_03690 [Eubacteriales bacterium OttesenSCG-928-A19]|nr:hypothetical protein [Eubacteriales bacterium OttesenSCG-928-A19]
MDEALRKELSDINKSIAALETNVKAAFKRIDEQKSLVDSVHSLALSMERMLHRLDEVCKDVSQMEQKVSALEGKPAKRWEQVLSAGISSFIGVIVGAVMALFIKK